MNNTLPKFHELRADRVLNTFKIDKKKHSEHLNNWLQHSEMIMPNDKILLDIALDRYNRLGDGWNEEELKMHFVSLIFAVADTNIDKVCKTFYERPITGVVQEKQLHVICDCMIAQPDRAGLPTKPYFFFFKSLNKPNALAKPTPKGKCWQLCCLPKK